MKEVLVKNQKELDAALKAGDYPVLTEGYFEVSGSSTVTAYDSSTVTASDSSTVTAFDSSTVRASVSSTVTASASSTVTAYDSSTVTASGSSTVRASGSSTVTASGSSTVTASGAAQVIARHAVKVIATAYVAVTILGAKVSVTGGIEIRPPDINTGKAWCDAQGVEVKRGVAVLYKAVDAQWKSAYGMSYKPGTTPSAADWDGGKAECGGGLHFFPQPWMAHRWNPDFKHIVACPVKVSEIAAHGWDAQFPDKVKAPRVCAPCYEVDIEGNRIEPAKPKRTAKKAAA